MNFAQLKFEAKNQIKGKIGILFVISLIIGAISYLAGATLVGAIIVSPAFALSTALVYLGIARGDKPEVSDAFCGFEDFWSAFKVSFLSGIYVFLWSLLLVIPGIIKAISYSQAMYILAENKGMSAKTALEKSQVMMHGHKGDYVLLQLSFIGWHLLAGLTLGILYIWLIPYMQTTMANFYLKVKEESAGRNEMEILDLERQQALRAAVAALAVLLIVAIFAVGAVLFEGELLEALIGAVLMVIVTPGICILLFKLFFN